MSDRKPNEFEKAAALRDHVVELRRQMVGTDEEELKAFAEVAGTRGPLEPWRILPRSLGFSVREQEVVASPNPDCAAAFWFSDPSCGHGTGAIHLHAVVSECHDESDTTDKARGLGTTLFC